MSAIMGLGFEEIVTAESENLISFGAACAIEQTLKIVA